MGRSGVLRAKRSTDDLGGGGSSRGSVDALDKTFLLEKPGEQKTGGRRCVLR